VDRSLMAGNEIMYPTAAPMIKEIANEKSKSEMPSIVCVEMNGFVITATLYWLLYTHV
jgi:hypothetical protein